MAMVTAAVRAGGVPLRRVFVEHRGAFGVSLGWTLTDENGSFTFDAGLGFNRVDVRVHGRNSVIRVVDDSDLIPGTAWVHLPITMGYDRFPEKLIDEKEALLTDLLARNGRLFYTHDAKVALSGIGRDAQGRFHATEPVAAPVDLAS